MQMVASVRRIRTRDDPRASSAGLTRAEGRVGGRRKKLDTAKRHKIAESVTLTASGLDNGQAFPSINTMDKPETNADGSTDIYFGSVSPGEGKNWLRTVADKGFFVILRLYGPTEPFFSQSWKPGDIEECSDLRSAGRVSELHVRSFTNRAVTSWPKRWKPAQRWR